MPVEEMVTRMMVVVTWNIEPLQDPLVEVYIFRVIRPVNVPMKMQLPEKSFPTYERVYVPSVEPDMDVSLSVASGTNGMHPGHSVIPVRLKVRVVETLLHPPHVTVGGAHPLNPAVVQPFPPAVVHPCAPAILTTCPELRSRDYHGAVGIRVNQSPHPVQAELVRRGVEVVPCVGKPKFWGI